jgi:hypothetical protein
MPSYGPLVSFNDVELALVGHLQTWINSYLAGREALVGKTAGEIARPASWFVKQTFTALPGEDRTPAIIVVSTGTSEAPKKRGDGNWDATLRLGVLGLCHGPETEAARELAGHYQAALLGICLQQRSLLNGKMKLWNWEGMGLDDVDQDQTRTLCAARLEFVYQIQGFSTENDGPKTVPVPPTDPLPTDPEVLTVNTQTGVLP